MALPGLEVIKELMHQTEVGESPEIDQTVWLCANCGEARETNEGHCQHCGGDTFALLETAISASSGQVPVREQRKVTAVTVLAWLVGLMTLLHAIVSLLLLTFAVPFFGIATVASFPPARRWYERQTGYTLTTGAAIVVYGIFMIVGYIALFFP